MTSKERVKIAMSGGVPDRVPVIPQICHPHALRSLGLDFRKTLLKCLEEPSLVNQLDLQCARRYGVDGIRLWMPGESRKIEEDGDSAWQVDEETGRRVGRVDFQGGGDIAPLVEQIKVETDEEVYALTVVPADELLETRKWKSFKEIVEDASQDLFVIGAPGSFTVEYGTQLRGKQQFLMDMLERPEFARRILEKGTASAIQNAIALKKIGMEALYIGETFGGFIGPRLFDEFCMPYFKEFVRALKPYDILTYLHICGNSTEILERMADTGVDCIEPLDPLGGVSVADAKRRVGHRVALMGGVNTLKLAFGTLEEVKEDIQRCLAEGAPKGGYLLACGDMLPTETSPEKVETMVREAHCYQY